MPDHDQEGPFDRAQPLKPSPLGQSKDKPAKSDPIAVRKPETGTCEQDMSQNPTRWRRIKAHPTFKPVLVVGGLVAVGGIAVLTLRSTEAIKQVSAAVLENVPEFTGMAFEGILEEASRKSPIEHMVSGYPRLQHYGPGGTKTKIVQISPYSRGGSA